MIRQISLFALFFGFGALTAFAQGQEPPKVTASQRSAIVDSVAYIIDSIYVFPDKARAMGNFIRKQQRAKAYDSAVTLQDLSQKLTDDLHSVVHDLHVWVEPFRDDVADTVPQETLDSLNEAERKFFNYGFKELRWLDGNVGYIKLNSFAPAEWGGPTAISAMNFFANADALIFDLRQNGGGDPSMIQLISSYLFDQPTHLNDFFLRADSSTQQFWTQAVVDGPKLTDISVYVLTSSNTFSAAEEFSYNLKNLKRGTIVGETTGGGAHPNNFYHFTDLGIVVSIPFGRAVNPITHTNWEGTGVEPDIACDPDQALLVAHLDALKKLLDKSPREQVRHLIAWKMDGIEAELHPYSPTPDELKNCAGVYGPRKVSFENGELWYQRGENPKSRLVPLSKNKFQLDGVDYFRVWFMEDSSGKIVELEGHYDNGQVDKNPRDS